MRVPFAPQHKKCFSGLVSNPLQLVDGAAAHAAWFKHINKVQRGEPCLITLRSSGFVFCVQYAPDGRRLATASVDGLGGKVTVFDARTSVEVAAFTFAGHVTSIAFSSDSKYCSYWRLEAHV
jgi:WD40 repeat protein